MANRCMATATSTGQRCRNGTTEWFLGDRVVYYGLGFWKPPLCRRHWMALHRYGELDIGERRLVRTRRDVFVFLPRKRRT